MEMILTYIQPSLVPQFLQETSLTICRPVSYKRSQEGGVRVCSDADLRYFFCAVLCFFFIQIFMVLRILWLMWFLAIICAVFGDFLGCSFVVSTPSPHPLSQWYTNTSYDLPSHPFNKYLPNNKYIINNNLILTNDIK